MIPLVDMHCHLLAGLDDGPKTPQDALAMCRMAYDEGVRMASALAHQNERWPAVTPERIRAAVRELAAALRDAATPLSVIPCAEVMAHPEMVAAWRAGRLLSVADRGKYLLVEMPHGVFVDLRPAIKSLHQAGICLILAHPERQAELLYNLDLIEELVGLGCLVQVSTGSVTEPCNRRAANSLKVWFRRGIAHLIGSDGHSPTSRPPRLAAAYDQIVRWAGQKVADRVCSTNGMAILSGLPLRVAPPRPQRRIGFFRLWR
jgi:protein-tyrosine phosphatase